MSDFSRRPQDVLKENRDKNYVGMHFMQGVPILDRDLNLMQDLVTATVRDVIGRYIGSGVPIGSGSFEIVAAGGDAENDFRISAGDVRPGVCMVSGIEVSIRDDIVYSAQQPEPPTLTTPANAARSDLVYLDVYLDTVDTDELLDNDHDVAVQTSVRLLPVWTVRVAEGAATLPAPGVGHTYFALATLKRKRNEARITQSTIIDGRKRCLTLDGVLNLLVAPEITTLSPSQGGVDAQITISGTRMNVAGKTTVRFGDIPVADGGIVEVTPGTVKVKVPAGGEVGRQVKVYVSNGAGTAESGTSFKFL